MSERPPVDPRPLEQLLERMDVLRAELAGHDLTVRRFRALRALADEPLRLGQLAERIAIRPPSCVTLVNALAADGLLARVGDPADARASLVELTPAGWHRLADATAAAAAALGREA